MTDYHDDACDCVKCYGWGSEALYAFDAENDIQPARTIAIGIAWKHGHVETHPIVDSISHAIEDAREIGERRARAAIPKIA